ncbi:glycosyltransferase [Clostridium aciditolerans]|uniref:Glycosyltransferase n=1 Tax=Clostridium aciditolerans TaxID=339861 RepID=A0A934M403_9CLOT|nr:glycosyltransferase [Clostridium aciditolerans]MBI6873585.1 glycosyltransferase [Clostridium aciditolerans]
MENYPIFSFIIVSYRNYHYIFECIDSVLTQDYPNIEIIISNDGSDDFDEMEIRDYINRYKSKNIKSVVINNNSTNLGTVKNINKALSFATGEYIMIIAADDALFNNSVFSNFANYFEENKDILVVTSQCKMYDIDLKTFQTNAVQPNQVQMIKNYTSLELYNEISVACLIPAGACCFRREIYRKYGYYDEEIFLIEDWSFFLRIVRMGAKIGWLDITAIKHRDGGISHGNVNNDTKAMFHYYDDVIKITEKEILPYMNMLTRDKRKHVKKEYNNVKIGYVKKYKWHQYSFLDKFIYCVTHFSTISNKLLEKTGVNHRNMLDKLSSKKRVLFIFATLMLLIYSVCDFKNLMPTTYALIMKLLVGYIGLTCFISSFVITGLLILRKMFRKVMVLGKLFIK